MRAASLVGHTRARWYRSPSVSGLSREERPLHSSIGPPEKCSCDHPGEPTNSDDRNVAALLEYPEKQQAGRSGDDKEKP